VTYFPLEDAEAGGGFIVPKAAWDAAVDPSLPEGAAEVNGQRFEWASQSDPPPSDPEAFLIPPAYVSCIAEIPRTLLDDYAGFGDALNDYLARGLRGELPPSPPRQPKRHRCLACWLLSLLPGHDRCSHGYAESGCETCGEW
jgi:hypothetical protein